MATSKTNHSTRRTRAKRATSPAKPKQAVVAKTPAATTPTTNSATPTTTKRSWWQRTPRAERPVRPKLLNVWQLTKSAYRLLTLNWRLILGIAAVYGVLNVLLVRGLNGGLDVAQLKSQFNQLYNGGWGNIASGFSVFALLVSSSSSGNSDAAGAYQSFLVLITSLALVWTFRQLLADKVQTLRIRDGFYKGLYPLVPVILILLVISLQLIPLLIGGVIFSIVIANGIAVSALEVAFWLALFLALAAISLLWITSSVFGLYIVSLPDMTPIQALRSSKKLVRFRRGTVLRKLLFLPLLILLILSAFILPVIFIVPVLAQWVFFALSTLILPAVHAYIYTLYRELLND